jgi:hypothetical protein
MSTGRPYPYDDPGWSLFGEQPSKAIVEQNHQLAAENAQLRAEMASREERAYEHGLGDAAKVYRENRILAATIAALTDRQHAMRLTPAHLPRPIR